MNSIYLYSGSFMDLLNLIFELLKLKIKPYNIKVRGYNQDLFSQVIDLKINNNKNIEAKFIKIFGKHHFKIIHYIFLSNEENKEIIIYYFLLNYFKYRENLTKMRNLKCVSKALEISKRVGNEAHKIKGFVRFQELYNNVLYAEINPTNNVLEIVSNHFKKRLKEYYFIIKDVNRNIISIYNKKDIYIIPSDNIKLYDEKSENEDLYQDLWCDFYKTIGISERTNNRCRMNFMPKKYWQYILEVRDELCEK